MATLDPTRLTELAQQLGQSPEAVARTLHDELVAARARIDAGLAANDLGAVSDAAHAARNSVLMVAAQPLLGQLRALQTAADGGRPATAREAWGRADTALARLIEALGGVSR